MPATYEQAMLMMELHTWHAMEGGADAALKVHARDFDRDSADALDAEVQTTLVYYETVGAFVTNGLLDKEFVLDLLWAKGAWDRVGPAALRAREELGEPKLFEHFEALARD